MSQESDRELLVRIDERTENMQKQLLDPPDGRVPKLERIQEQHAKQINQWTGGMKLAAWVIGGLFLTFGGVLLAHVMGGKP